MSDWQGCIPYVGAIIERTNSAGTTELLIQTRSSPKWPSIYNGTFEFAAGTLDRAYENVYDAITREVKEETGLIVSEFINRDSTQPVSPQKIDKAFGFRPYCCTQQLLEGRPWVGFIFRCKVEDGKPTDQPGESKDVHWASEEEILKLYKETPEQLFALEVPAWEYYFHDKGLIN